MRSLNPLRRDRTGTPRLLALGGSVLVLVGLGLSWSFAPPVPDGQALPQRLLEAFLASGICAVVACAAAFIPWNWLSVAALVAAFAGAFVAHFGWYFLLFAFAYHPFALVGLGELLYAVAAVGMAVAMLRRRAHRSGNLARRANGYGGS